MGDYSTEALLNQGSIHLGFVDFEYTCRFRRFRAGVVMAGPVSVQLCLWLIRITI